MCEKNDSLAILGDYDEFEEGDEGEMLRKLFKNGPLTAYLDITTEFQLYKGKDKVGDKLSMIIMVIPGLCWSIFQPYSKF